MSNDPLVKYLTKNRLSISQNLHKGGSLYKEYKRFPVVELPVPLHLNNSVSELLLSRKSRRGFGAKVITMEEISTLLYLSAGITSQTDKGEKRRAQPSGGAKYPIEIYLVSLQNTNSLKKGVYHYNVKNHSLEKLLMSSLDVGEVIPSHDEYALTSQYLMYFSFIKNRSFEKYGALAYKLAHIEAGHISQSLYLVTEALGLSGCGLGTSNAHDLDRVLMLEEEIESIFYAFTLGARK